MNCLVVTQECVRRTDRIVFSNIVTVLKIELLIAVIYEILQQQLTLDLTIP